MPHHREVALDSAVACHWHKDQNAHASPNHVNRRAALHLAPSCKDCLESSRVGKQELRVPIRHPRHPMRLLEYVQSWAVPHEACSGLRSVLLRVTRVRLEPAWELLRLPRHRRPHAIYMQPAQSARGTACAPDSCWCDHHLPQWWRRDSGGGPPPDGPLAVTPT